MSIDRMVRPRDLPDALLARGKHWTTTSEIADAIGGSLVDARQAASRWQAKRVAFSPTRGMYVLIPPQFRTWEAVPASHFIDDMMKFLGHEYYVGFLSAAEVHDAAHQRPQTFQVVTRERLKARTFGRVHVEFIVNTRIDHTPTITVNTPTGTMNVSTPEATVLDLVSAPEHGGGLSNIATIIGDLLDDAKLDINELTRIAPDWPATVVQRTGWLLDHMATETDAEIDTDPLAALAKRGGNTAKLVPSGSSGRLDPRWSVIVNADIEPVR